MTRRPSDHSAYAEFVAARSASLFRTAYLVIGDYQLAEDLLEDSLVKAYVAWPRLREVASAEAYTRRIIVTTAISRRRRRSFGERPTGELPEAAAAPDETEQINTHATSCGTSCTCCRPGNGLRSCCASARTCPRHKPLS